MRGGFVCPRASKWNEIYTSLKGAREEKLRRSLMNREKLHIPNPPVPLILAAWDAPDSDKRARWQETVVWANNYEFSSLIPELKEEECYFG